MVTFSGAHATRRAITSSSARSNASRRSTSSSLPTPALARCPRSRRIPTAAAYFSAYLRTVPPPRRASCSTTSIATPRI